MTEIKTLLFRRGNKILNWNLTTNKLKTKYNALAQGTLESLYLSKVPLSIYKTLLKYLNCMKAKNLLFVTILFFLSSCNNSQEGKNATEVETENKIEAVEYSTPNDSILMSQIIASIALDGFSIEAIRQTINITKKRDIASGFVLETEAFSGAPCEQIQISSFDKNGTLIQALPLTLSCDCPSACEGCFDWKSVHWTNDTHFYVKREHTIVLNTNENPGEFDDECETEVLYSKTEYEIQSTGEIKEEAPKRIPQKQAILIDLQGKHSLNSISALSGANILYDYTKNDGEWLIEGSSIHQGRREAFEIELSEKDLLALNTLEVIVQEDQTCELVYNGEIVFKVPFDGTRLSYQLAQAPEDYITGIPDSLNQKTTLLNDKLYVAVKDEVPQSLLEDIDIVIRSADAYTLAYNNDAHQFELTLFYAACCDNATYIFKNANQY